MNAMSFGHAEYVIMKRRTIVNLITLLTSINVIKWIKQKSPKLNALIVTIFRSHRNNAKIAVSNLLVLLLDMQTIRRRLQEEENLSLRQMWML